MKGIFFKTIVVLGITAIFIRETKAAVEVKEPFSVVAKETGGKDSSTISLKDSIASAIAAFKSLPRSERRGLLKEAKQQLKEYRAHKPESTDKTLLIILAILLPPLGVYLHEGEINTKFWIDLLLTFLFWLPGAIYALVVVLNKD